MNFNLEIKNLKKLGLPQSEFVVVGSGSLSIRGIRESKDLDIVVTPLLWNDLIQKYGVRVNESGVETISIGEFIEILSARDSVFGNSTVVPIADVLGQADVIDGIPYISLDHLKKIKLSMGREKDLKDVALIERYLSLKQ